MPLATCQAVTDDKYQAKTAMTKLVNCLHACLHHHYVGSLNQPGLARMSLSFTLKNSKQKRDNAQVFIHGKKAGKLPVTADWLLQMVFHDCVKQ
jgi:hypothetical protein